MPPIWCATHPCESDAASADLHRHVPGSLQLCQGQKSLALFPGIAEAFHQFRLLPRSFSRHTDSRWRTQEYPVISLHSIRSLTSAISALLLVMNNPFFADPVSERTIQVTSDSSAESGVQEMQQRWSYVKPRPELQRVAESALHCGEVAVVLLAGGQGSRLGSSDPKGCFPISPVRGASLFQLFAEHLGSAAQRWGVELPLVVWVSDDNHDQTRAFWEAHNHWGLHPEFVVQPSMPLLDDQHHPIHCASGQLATAPNGNGSLWATLAARGILGQWRERGIRAVLVIPVDNPLAMPIDLDAIGLVCSGSCSALLFSTSRRSPTEAVGVILHDEARIAEYSELPESARAEAGWRRYPEGFLGMMAWSLDEAESAALRPMPIHLARKHVLLQAEKILCWKQEYFLFDALAGRSGVGIFSVDRASRFAPLKSAEGEYGIAATQQALIRAAQARMARLGATDLHSVKEIDSDLWIMETAPWVIDPHGWVDHSTPPGSPRLDVRD
jgi:UDP-N-acetylglucosamine/UDP-N-acetylgalactosamine diphosphorylase